MWHEHFNSLLNSCTDFSRKESVLNQINTVTDVDRFNVKHVKDAIKELKKNKSPGADMVASEHYIHACEKVNVLLSLLFNCVMIHAFIPKRLMETLIVPIIKDSKGVMTDKDNYRPIALTCVSSKILELLVMHRFKDNLITNDSQFSFKGKHSTDMCVFALKEVVQYYVSKSSPIYLCFMDASKAFDKVNHWQLFDKLLACGIPLYIVRLLCVWYTSQDFIIRWSNVLSSSFNVTNGVRQGGILSPILFNIFMDDLSILLTRSNIGCHINSKAVNHLFYADDSVLIAPSPYALKKLIEICEQFSNENEILYNPKKTECMFVNTSRWRDLVPPPQFLYGKALRWVTECKYLGVFITNDFTDDCDMKR